MFKCEDFFYQPMAQRFLCKPKMYSEDIFCTPKGLSQHEIITRPGVAGAVLQTPF